MHTSIPKSDLSAPDLLTYKLAYSHCKAPLLHCAGNTAAHAAHAAHLHLGFERATVEHATVEHASN